MPHTVSIQHNCINQQCVHFLYLLRVTYGFEDTSSHKLHPLCYVSIVGDIRHGQSCSATGLKNTGQECPSLGCFTFSKFRYSETKTVELGRGKRGLGEISMWLWSAMHESEKILVCEEQSGMSECMWQGVILVGCSTDL